MCGRVSAECAELHRGSLNVRRQPPSATGSGTCEARAVFFFSFVGENSLHSDKFTVSERLLHEPCGRQGAHLTGPQMWQSSPGGQAGTLLV